jgi:hypothetical protein
MAKHVFMIMVNAAEGQDDALNEYLDKVHLPEVLQTEGFRSVHRFQLPPEEANNPKAKHRYMHFYEVETDDLAKTMAALREGHPTRTPLPPSMDVSDVFAVFYSAR